MFKRLLVGLGLFAGVVGKVIDCSSSNALYEIESLSFSPDPPLRNAEATITMIYNAYDEVSVGKVDYSVTLNGLPVYSEKDELCTQTSCPINVGTHNETSVFTWPDVSGKVSAKTVWYNEKDEELLCFQTIASTTQTLRGSLKNFSKMEIVSYSTCKPFEYFE